ncbi:MAG: hypothetical protein ACLFPS_01375 [Clostridia bacterium]
MEIIDKITSLKQYFLMNINDLDAKDLIYHLSQINAVDVFHITDELEILNYHLNEENNEEFYEKTLESGFMELNDFSFDITTPVVKEYDVGQRALLYDNKDWSILTNVYAIPLVKNGQDYEHLILFKYEDQFEQDFIYFAIIISLIFSVLVQSKIKDFKKNKDESKQKVQIAIDALSYSEMQAAKHILDKIEGSEGYLVASKVADKFEITRSIIVNALRKLESAGLIKSKSLGMKGTHIKILNEDLKDILNIRD